MYYAGIEEQCYFMLRYVESHNPVFKNKKKVLLSVFNQNI